jgi:hypothetical protein
MEIGLIELYFKTRSIEEYKMIKIESKMFVFLSIILVILKLTHVINWSWWLIILPLFIPMVIAIIRFAILALGMYFLAKKLRYRIKTQ